MKFFHLSDLHIGKQLHHYNLREDQEYILREVTEYAKRLAPDAIVIAGDIYDKSVPSAEAVAVFDDFLTALADLQPSIPLLLIAGNHDSAERLDYASQILKRQNIYIAGKAPESAEDHIKKVTLEDEVGEVDFYLLPFLKPGYVRKVFEEGMPESYQKAVEGLIEREHVDWKRRNVLVSHQFYMGAGEEPDTCDSEVFSVGGLDRIDISGIRQFDYAALGHLHGAQQVGDTHIRYCGTLLKYSVSESEQEKSLHVVTLGEKGQEVQVEQYPLHPLRNVRKVRGELAEILANADPSEREDYISITLTDEIDPYRPKEQLEKVFSHILEVRMDNTRTRQKLKQFDDEVIMKDPLAIFSDFYREMQGRGMTEEEAALMQEILKSVEEE